MPLSRIDKNLVAEWVRSMVDSGLSASRIRQAHQCLSAILEVAADDGLIGRNPARKVELPTLGEPEHRYLTAEQVARLAESMPDDQARTIVYLLAYGGLRWGELVALRRDRMDVLRRRLEIAESAPEKSGRLTFGTPKTNRRRTVHVPGFVADLLGRRLDVVPHTRDAFVFTSPMGHPLRSSNFRRTIWNRARNLAGTDLSNITPHDLRHTCASLMRAEGADVKEFNSSSGIARQRSLLTSTPIYSRVI